MKKIVLSVWDRLADWSVEDVDREVARVMVLVLSAVLVVVGAAILVDWVIGDDPRWLLLLIPPALSALWEFVRWLFKIEKKEKKTDGGDRQAEEGSQDPGAYATGGIIPGYFAVGSGSGYATLSGTSIIGLNPFAPPTAAKADAKIEEVEGDVPILAHRAAVLRFDGTAKHFGSVNADFGSFGIDADATCGDVYRAFGAYALDRRERHDAPSVGCSCGFYALPPDMHSTYEGLGFVQLLVELSGTVIEHEQGYRAGHQSVVECQLPACPYCGAQVNYLIVENSAMVAAHCGRHEGLIKPGQTVVAAEDVERLIGVPVTRLGLAS